MPPQLLPICNSLFMIVYIIIILLLTYYILSNRCIKLEINHLFKVYIYIYIYSSLSNPFLPLKFQRCVVNMSSLFFIL